MSQPIHQTLHQKLEQISHVGATPDGGVHRPEGTPENGEARHLLIAWLRKDGYDVHIDNVGNIFGLANLAGSDAPLVLTGSHIDSQPHAGRLDGAYGVVASYLAANRLRDEISAQAVQPRANIGIVAWSNEEGARFQPSTLGSSVYSGHVEADWALARTDLDGVSFGQALEQIGFLGADTPPPMPSAFVELHVECGSELERNGQRIGVFDTWWGVRKVDLELIGEAAHTGPTPMNRRRDALFAAALVIAGVRDLADNQAPGALHTSVGQIDVVPNSPNVVPAHATLRIELRSGQMKLIDEAHKRLNQIIAAASKSANVSANIVRDELRPPGLFSNRLVKLAEDASLKLGHPLRRLETICGHDAMRLAPHCDSVVLAVPSIGGICHAPAEDTRPEDLELGLDLLTGVLRELLRGTPTRPSQTARTEKISI